MKAFISHSQKDLKIVNRIFRMCKRTKIEPQIAEFEKIEEGRLGPKEIRDMIRDSELFFMFLSENVVNDKDYRKTIYTQNWVNFELGCVYSEKKDSEKQIWLFEPFQQVHFPVPYLDFYVLYDPESEQHWEYLEKVFADEEEFRHFMTWYYPIAGTMSLVYRLKGTPIQRPSVRYGYPITHRCGAKYVLLSKPESWYCPVCRHETNWMPE